MPDTGAPAAATMETSAAALPSRGIHHLALTTEDMQMTTDFFVKAVSWGLWLSRLKMAHPCRTPQWTMEAL